MGQSFTLFLSTSPYSHENTLSAIRLLGSALKKGHEVNLIASGDGIYNLLKGQKYNGVPDAGKLFSDMINKGLTVYLCGGCLSYRRVAKKDYLQGVQVIKAKACLKILERSDVWINL